MIIKESFVPVRLLTLNVRYATSSPVAGEHPWAIRCPKLCTTLSFVTASQPNAFICLQEVLASQLADIQAHLGPAWSSIGVGRDDGLSAGEFSPIFYRADAWRCDRRDTRWLSETPRVPSRGWDAALPRIVTIGSFSSRTNPAFRMVVMSTHFDHVGVEARRNSASLLIRLADHWSDGVSAVLVGGDFNSDPRDGAYRVMTAPNSPMADVSSLIPAERHYGNSVTYTSFGEPDEAPQKIDFLFLRRGTASVVRTFGVLANSFDDQIRISDHRPVVADIDVPCM